MELIIESGGPLPTVRQIAARSFLSPAAIYVHFPNFDAIVESVRVLALESLLGVIEEAEPASPRDGLATLAQWIIDNPALTVASTTACVTDECAKLFNACLVASGGDEADPRLIRLAVQLCAPAPMLIDEFGYGPEQLESYLASLGGPLSMVSAQPPIEVIHA